MKVVLGVYWVFVFPIVVAFVAGIVRAAMRDLHVRSRLGITVCDILWRAIVGALFALLPFVLGLRPDDHGTQALLVGWAIATTLWCGDDYDPKWDRRRG